MSEAAKWLKSKINMSVAQAQAALAASVVDAKAPQRIQKIVLQLLVFVTNKKLNLKNSPPYLQGILCETQELITNIFKLQTLDFLKSEPYINIFLTKFIAQCKKTTKLFKDAKEMMEDEKSPYRRDLSKLTLVFSHMLSEFKTIYKDGKYTPDFKIVKLEAREFWEGFFKKRIIVPWADFIKEFKKVHRISSAEEERALKATIDLMENDHVSWFEFDVFTRLFQPWAHIVNNWNAIVCAHPGYKAFMTYDEVEGILKKLVAKPGSYVFRLSCTRLGQWAIGFVAANGDCIQTIPQSKSLYQALIDGAEDKTYIYPNGLAFNPDIRKNVQITAEQHIKVTKEQYEIYCNIDTTFELCKICDTRLKSVRLDPCGHLLCHACLAHWMESSSQGAKKAVDVACPFCRAAVISTESIIVDPYADDDDDSDDLPAIVMPTDAPRTRLNTTGLGKPDPEPGKRLASSAALSASEARAKLQALRAEAAALSASSSPSPSTQLNLSSSRSELLARSGQISAPQVKQATVVPVSTPQQQQQQQQHADDESDYMPADGNQRGNVKLYELAEFRDNIQNVPEPTFVKYTTPSQSTNALVSPSSSASISSMVSATASSSAAPSTVPSAAPSAAPLEAAPEDVVQRFIDMGFERAEVLKALRIAKNDLNVAMDILISFS